MYRLVHTVRASEQGGTARGAVVEEVRQRVLAAAEEVFAARGYGAATTREIAARAAIGKRMLFYYFPNKDALYRAVLESTIARMIDVHERFRGDPGPVGLGEAIEGMTYLVASHLPAFKVLMREIMDGGPHLPMLARERLAPLFARGVTEVERNMEAGIFRAGEPMHVLANVGGITLYYFLLVPLLELIWDREPLAPATLEARVAATRECILHGLAAPPRAHHTEDTGR